VRSLVEPLLWKNGYSNYNTELPIYPVFDENNPAPAEMFETKEFTDTVKPSKKGPLILLLLILGILLLTAIPVAIIVLIVMLIV
jgi:hypothetical protein